MARGPQVLGQIVAGNVPGLALWHMVSGLLIKSSVLTRLSHQEPLVGMLAARMISKRDHELGQCLAMAYWPSADTDTEHAFFMASNRLVVYGSQDTVEQVAKRAEGLTRVVAYGHRASLAVIGREALAAMTIGETVTQAALDVSMWDQQSCTSPHAILVEEGGRYSVQDFAARLGAELARREIKEPRAMLSSDEHLVLREFKQKLEWQDGLHVMEGRRNTWAVLYGVSEMPPTSCLNRTVLVVPIPQLTDATPWLESFRLYMQTVGVRIPRNGLWTLLGPWAEVGVTRVCALGDMADVPARWHHDGEPLWRIW